MINYFIQKINIFYTPELKEDKKRREDRIKKENEYLLKEFEEDDCEVIDLEQKIVKLKKFYDEDGLREYYFKTEPSEFLTDEYKISEQEMEELLKQRKK